MTTKTSILIATLLLLLLVLAGLYSFAERKSDKPLPEPNQKTTHTPAPDNIYPPKNAPANKPASTKKTNSNTQTPPEFTSGESRFSQGTCDQDNDCQVGGCSGEVCSSKENIMSTCEYREDFPNKENYNCGCYNNVCGWKPR